MKLVLEPGEQEKEAVEGAINRFEQYLLREKKGGALSVVERAILRTFALCELRGLSKSGSD